MFITFTKAEYISCNIQKGENNNIEYSKGDTIEINVITDFYSEDGILDSSHIQLYYNPYVLELLSDYDSESAYIEDGYKITNFNTYSSIIDFDIKNISGKNMYVNGADILITKLKFKVKEDANYGYTSIELISNNSNFNIKNDNDTYPCNNSKLYYNIKDASKINIDTTLSNIHIINEQGTILDIKPDTTTYNLNVEYDKITIIPYCSSSECEYKINNKDDKTFTLKEGNNKIEIINDIDGNKTKYTLNINYKKPVSEFKYALLKRLSVENFKFLEEFKEETFKYHLVVPSDVDSLLIDYDADDDINVEIIGNENFITGENIVRIKTNNDFDSENYYIIVTKTEKEDDNKIPTIEPKEETKEEIKKTNNKYILIGLFSILIVLSYILYDIFYSRKKKLKEKSTTHDVSINEETDNEENNADETNDKE